jgi:hypothetical protein
VNFCGEFKTKIYCGLNGRRLNGMDVSIRCSLRLHVISVSVQLISCLCLTDYAPTATTERMTEFEEGTQLFLVSILS